MEKTTKSEKILSVIFCSFIILFFCFIILRIVTRQIFVRHFGMNNSFTELVFFDAHNLNKKDNPNSKKIIPINWEKLYPFDIEDHKNYSKKDFSIMHKDTVISKIKNKIEPYTTNYLPWHYDFVEFANGYEKTIGWNIVCYSEYNGITQIEDQYLAALVKKSDVSELAQSTIELASFCKEKGINFSYIQQPSKICMYEDKKIYGSIDFSNQNMDSFLSILNNADVNTYDHRIDIHKENLNHHNMFYNTDHHWKAETGLWASKHVIDYLNNKYGYNLDSSILSSNNYSYDIFKDWFLGSQGKKVTLSVVNPEDITIIYPKFETSIHYQIPNLQMDEYGPFEITYDMTYLEQKDYYNLNPYAAYDYADQPLIKIENMLIDEGPKVLIIHNSFANCEIPFLAMSIKYIDAIDLRFFNGSLKKYIEQNNPDVVIVTYNSVDDNIDWTTHTNLFDFR